MIDVTQISSPEAGDTTMVYAVADIHGRLDLLEAMEAKIADDIARTAPARPLICYLGDYIDRGPHSAEVIERLRSSVSDGVRRVFLKGNHEDRMIAFIDDPEGIGPAWLKFGGREALESYGVAVPEHIGGKGWGVLGAAFRAALPPAHLHFLHALRLAFIWRGHMFVHAGIDPRNAMDRQSEHDLIWIREPFLSSDRDHGLRVVHGHVVVEEPAIRRNRIGIDTGAFKNGRLTCAAIDGYGVRLLQVDGPPG